MSKELEMLREVVEESSRRFSAGNTKRLRAILRRLELAERVCESCDEADEYHYWFDVDALRAYRALDGKGEG